MFPAPPRCLICNAALTFHQAHTHKVCDSARCVSIFNRLPADKTCAICGRVRAVTDQPPKVCSAPACHLRWMQQQREEEKQRKRAALVATAERLLEASGV